jgi:hypothetical protein
MQRVRVTSPQTRLAQRRGADAMGRLSHLSGRPPMPLTAIDLEAAERALRRQRRLAVRTAVSLLIALAALLTAAAVVPGRLGWAVLFFAPYPVLLALAALHVRRAEQVEDDHARYDHAPDDHAPYDRDRDGP